MCIPLSICQKQWPCFIALTMSCVLPPDHVFGCLSSGALMECRFRPSPLHHCPFVPLLHPSFYLFLLSCLSRSLAVFPRRSHPCSGLRSQQGSGWLPGSHSGYHDAFLLPLQLWSSFARRPAEISALPGQEPPRPPQSKGPLRSLQRGHDHRKRLGLRDILTPAPFRCAGHSFQSTYCHEPYRSCTDFWLWSTASVTRYYVIKHIWYAFVLPHLFALEIFSKAILITLTQVDWWWIAKCWLTSHTWRMMM